MHSAWLSMAVSFRQQHRKEVLVPTSRWLFVLIAFIRMKGLDQFAVGPLEIFAFACLEYPPVFKEPGLVRLAWLTVKQAGTKNRCKIIYDTQPFKRTLIFSTNDSVL